jgi:hypothetical protein
VHFSWQFQHAPVSFLIFKFTMDYAQITSFPGAPNNLTVTLQVVLHGWATNQMLIVTCLLLHHVYFVFADKHISDFCIRRSTQTCWQQIFLSFRLLDS